MKVVLWQELEFRSSTETSITALAYKLHLISYPGQVCLVRPGWYERCVAFVQQASHRSLLQPLCSAHVWLWFRERDMIDSPDGALQLFSYSVQCGSRSPCRCCRLWAAHRYRVIHMPNTCTGIKYMYAKICLCYFTCGYLHAIGHTHTHTHRKIDLYSHTEKWST